MAIGVACGDSPQSQPATIPVATAGAAVSTSGGSGATQSLSANNASISELAAAFEAAGIRSASRWAREVDEYRPYSVDDADYAKLRGELAKYNPAPGVVDQIISLLHLP